MNYTEMLTKTQAEIKDRYIPKKQRSLYLAKIFEDLHEQVRADRVRQCGTRLEFQITNLRTKLAHANFCKDRLCPMCTFRRSQKTFGQVSDCIEFLAPRGYQYLFLTLTLKNCVSADLVKTIDLLNSAKVKLFRRSKIKQFLQGAFCALEITYDDKNALWHPHLHCLLAVSSDYGKKVYLKHSEWRQFWKESLQVDYNPFLNIKAVKGANSDEFKRCDSVSYIFAVKEVTKYTVKDSEYLTGNFERDRSLVSSLIPALHKRKLISFSGCFIEARNALKLDDPVDGDLVNIDGFRNENEFLIARVFYNYNWRAGVYIRNVVEQDITPFSPAPPLAVNTGFVAG